MTRSTYGISFLALATGLAVSGSALAQTPGGPSTIGPVQPEAATSDGTTVTPPTPGAATDADKDSSGDIIVTAQRREERLQDVPIAVSAVSSDTLAKTGARDVTDIGTSVPALKITNNNAQVSARLRGIGSTGTGPGVENSIAIYVDGVYFGATNASLLALNNVQRVEVLKGPQGTLFGRNATGGLLQIITRTPSHTPSVEANVGYANYQTISGNLYATTGLTDTIAIDIAAQYAHQGKGYGTNLATGNPTFKVDYDYAIRSKLLFEPTDRTRITIAADYSKTDNNMNSFVLLPGTRAFPNGPVATTRGWDANTSRDSFARGWQAGGSLTVNQKIGQLSLLSLTAYRDARYDRAFDFDVTPNAGINPVPQIPYRYFGIPQIDRQFSQEFQLSSGGSGPFTWVLGAFYYRANSGYDPLLITFEGPTVGAGGVIPAGPYQFVTLNSRIKTESLAGYAQGTLAVGPATNVTLGVRYTDEDKTVAGRQFVDFLLPGPPDQTTVFNRQLVTAKKMSYRASIDHHFTDDIMIFASFNRGFKSGGFAAAAPADPGYLPEELDAYEIGIKSELFDRRLRLNLSAFHYNYTNIQIQRTSGAGTITTNGPSAKINGIDLEAEARLTDELRVLGGLTLVDDKFGNYPDAVITSATGGTNYVICPNVVPGSGVVCPPPRPGPPVVLPFQGSATGNRLPLASRATLSLSPQYTIRLANGGKIDLTGVYYYNSGWFSQADNVIKQKAHSQYNASARWTINDRFNVTAWGKNLSNVRTFNSQAVLPFDRQAVAWAPPRTYGMTLGARF